MSLWRRAVEQLLIGTSLCQVYGQPLGPMAANGFGVLFVKENEVLGCAANSVKVPRRSTSLRYFFLLCWLLFVAGCGQATREVKLSPKDVQTTGVPATQKAVPLGAPGSRKIKTH